MPNVIISAEQTALLIGSRGLSDVERKAVKASAFADIKTTYSIPKTVKIKVEVDDPTSASYRVVKDKATGCDLTVDSWGHYSGQVPAEDAHAPNEGILVATSDDVICALRNSTRIYDEVDDSVRMPSDTSLMFDAENSVFYFRA